MPSRFSFVLRRFYSGSTSQQADRDLLRLLNQDDLLVSLGSNGVPWTGSDLCDQLRCRFNCKSDCKDEFL